jgi:hypothetical protein
VTPEIEKVFQKYDIVLWDSCDLTSYETGGNLRELVLAPPTRSKVDKSLERVPLFVNIHERGKTWLWVLSKRILTDKQMEEVFWAMGLGDLDPEDDNDEPEESGETAPPLS